MKNIIVAQSGGPTAAINATLAGVLRRCGEIGAENVYGALYGVEGLLADKVVSLNDVYKDEEKLTTLVHTPSASLGSCRKKLGSADNSPEEYKKIAEIFTKYSIDTFFYIGGNDSMDTVDKLSAYFSGKGVNVIGIPKTIDNDLAMTDHTPGFGTASKYVCTSIAEVFADTSVYDTSSVVIVEIMGRDAGWLTASSGLCHTLGYSAPHLIYIPEIPFTDESFIEDVKKALTESKAVIIAASEGIRRPDGSYAKSVASSAADGFAHAALGGVGKFLEHLVSTKLGCKVRSIELSTLQRASAHIASKTDLAEAQTIGATAADMAKDGKTGVMAAVKRISSSPYSVEVVPVPVSEVANKVKHFPTEWLQNHKLSPEAVAYFLPLIEGEVTPPTKNGLPVHLQFRG